MFQIYKRFEKQNFYSEEQLNREIELPDSVTNNMGRFVMDPLDFVERSQHNQELVEDGRVEVSQRTKLFAGQLARIGSHSKEYYEDTFSSVLYRASQRLGKDRSDLGYWTKVAEDKPVPPIIQKKGIFFTDEVSPVYSFSRNDRIEDEILTVVDSRELSLVRDRLQKKEALAVMMGVPLHCVPISMTSSSLPSNILKSPASESKSLGDVLDPRRSALSKIFQDVEPSTIVTVDAEGGGGVKTYPSMCHSITRVVLLSFKNVRSADVVRARYELYLKESRPGVEVEYLEYKFTSDDIYKHKFVIMNDLIRLRVNLKRDLFMYTYYPGAMEISKYFSNSFAMLMSERSIEGAKRVSVGVLYDDDVRNSECVSKYYAEHIGVDYSRVKNNRMFIVDYDRVVSFSAHSTYLDRLCYDSQVQSIGGHYVSLADYTGCKTDSKLNVHFKVGLRGVNPSALSGFKIQGEEKPHKISGFDIHNCMFMQGYDKPVSRYFFRKYITLNDGNKLELPKQGIYYVVKDEFDRLLFYDYRDTRYTFNQRRAKMIKFGMAVVELSSEPEWRTSFVVWPELTAEFMSMYVDRDEYLSFDDELCCTSQMVELKGVYLCRNHGLAYGEGSTYISSVEFPTVGKDSGFQVSKGFAYKRTENYRTSYEDVHVKYMRKDKCDGSCISVKDVFLDCSLLRGYTLYSLAEFLSE